tara:strand:+ start:13928 stop:14803 length:876 start_codon:yes stop_codon:yes gene_type:complete
MLTVGEGSPGRLARLAEIRDIRMSLKYVGGKQEVLTLSPVNIVEITGESWLMKTLVLGATGATGRLVAADLLARGGEVRAIVRSADRLPQDLLDHPNLTVIEGSVLDLPEKELRDALEGCKAVISCLGHNLTLKGMFGSPRRLVADSVSRICSAIQTESSAGITKVILMNSTGCKDTDAKETPSVFDRIVVGLIRLLVPPHADNEAAARFLRSSVGKQDHRVKWVIVRPDGLINEPGVSDYCTVPSPTRSPIFNSGKSSRVNVARFMDELASSEEVWAEWVGRSPVLYNRD